MNPVFFIGLFGAAFLLWLLLSFLYRPIGRIGHRLADDAKKAMTEDENQNENNNNNENKGEE
jgi:hypothetical protein